MSDALPLVPTSSDFGEQHQVQPEVENVSQTGTTNNLAPETDIDAISVATPMFFGGGGIFTAVYADITQCFFCPEIPRWRTYTGCIVITM